MIFEWKRPRIHTQWRMNKDPLDTIGCCLTRLQCSSNMGGRFRSRQGLSDSRNLAQNNEKSQYRSILQWASSSLSCLLLPTRIATCAVLKASLEAIVTLVRYCTLKQHANNNRFRVLGRTFFYAGEKDNSTEKSPQRLVVHQKIQSIRREGSHKVRPYIV